MQQEKEELKAKVKSHEDTLRDLQFDQDERARQHDFNIKDFEEQQDKKMQGVINDYERILATMQQQ